MVLAAFAFLILFLLIASAGLLLFYRQAVSHRLSGVLRPADDEKSTVGRLQAKATGSSIAALFEPLQRVLPKSPNEVSVLQQRLIRAGYRNDWAVNVFYGAKVTVPAALALFATITSLYSYGPFFIYAVSVGIGYLLPDFWLGSRIKKRQLNIRLGLTDVLDLLVVCIEAGLSLDQSVVRASEELRLSHPDICDELGVVVLEQRAGRPRAEAWKNFANRADVESVTALVTILVQAEQFGTSVARTLRVHSETLRVKRRQHVEELAAKTTVKLIFPLVFFIFPSFFVAAMGPAIISLMDSFNKYFS
jgi:tight adherence protein C